MQKEEGEEGEERVGASKKERRRKKAMKRGKKERTEGKEERKSERRGERRGERKKEREDPVNELSRSQNDGYSFLYNTGRRRVSEKPVEWYVKGK